MRSQSSSSWNSVFALFSPRSTRDERLIAYIVRRHGLGRSCERILTDPSVLELKTPEQRGLLIEEPALLHALRADYEASA